VKDLLVMALADYRLALIVSKDQVFQGVRAQVGLRANRSRFWHALADLLNCPYCVGVWGALFLCLGYSLRPVRFLAWLLAVAGLQDALHGLVWGDEHD
jgi:hypothetical protein